MKAMWVCAAVLFAGSAAYAEDARPVVELKPAAAVAGEVSIVEGYRGLTMPLPGYQLSGIKPGSFVDVMVTFEAVMKDDRKEMITATILQNVLVVKVDRPEKMTEDGAVQLLLNPNEAQYAALSRTQAKAINIAVRAPGDKEMHPMEMASFRKLFK